MDSVETKASAKYIRISARKARLVVDLIRGRDVADAQQILDYSPKAAARTVAKILNSAIANAEHNNKLDPDDLYVCRAYVDEGPTLKRFRPRAMGRATRINKRTSHITLVLDEREPRPESKRRRLRRPVRKKAAAEALEALEAAESETPPQADADETKLNADVEADLAEEAPEADTEANEDAEEDLDTDDTEADKDLDEPEEADEAPEAQQADADETKLNADTATAEPSPQAEDDRTELNADTKADDSESED